MFFRLMELECSLVSHGSEAVPTLGRLRPDVLILDLDLPDLRALEIAQGIRAVLPRLAIIFLTESATPPALPFPAPIVQMPRAGKFEEMLKLFEVVLAVEEG